MRNGQLSDQFQHHSRFSSTKVLKCFICFAGVYIGWFLFVVQNLSLLPPVPKEGLILSSTFKNENFLRSIDVNKNQGSDSDANIDQSNVVEVNSKVLEDVTKDKRKNQSHHRVQLNAFKYDKYNVEKAILSFSSQYESKIKPFTAFLEKPIDYEVPNTGSQGSKDPKDKGTPPEFVKPQPLRTNTPENLKKIVYPRVQSCHDLQAQLPVDRGLQFDKDGQRLFKNTGNKRNEYNTTAEAEYCPSEGDPFLPWIHDAFAGVNGDVIHFVAQNKRRCNTGRQFLNVVKRMEPQVALMQPISIKRLNDDKDAQELAPELWDPNMYDNDSVEGLPRYRLATLEEADGDGQFTRFICRFHTIEYAEEINRHRDVILGETLSTYPINYEFVSLRKRTESMLTRQGKDNPAFWLSNFRFDCPIPDNGDLQKAIQSGSTVSEDGTPSIYVDIVPIRTSPRYGRDNLHLKEEMINSWDWLGQKFGRKKGTFTAFDPAEYFGNKNVIPRVEASGRLQNIPVCTAPRPDGNTGSNEIKKDMKVAETGKKAHTLSACLWASATFETRGGVRKVNDAKERIKEWLEFHLLAGFDHVYVYDNTGAHSNEDSLEDILSTFSSSEVTRIDWPSIVCNNNVPAHENTGERSSQYAAESSCRQRYGPHTEWMASFDADEYFIPSGKYNDLKDVVNDAAKEGINVLSFRSTRAYADYAHTVPFTDDKECKEGLDQTCRSKDPDSTFLETYNCDFLPLPKPSWSDRAKKQIYRPDYVLSHFVHYSTITKGILQGYHEATELGRTWNLAYNEPISSERFTNETSEAVMLHSKTTDARDTKGWEKFCKLGFVGGYNDKCRIGFPFPNNIQKVNSSNSAGFENNCWKNEKLTEYFLPKLKEAMKKRYG